MRLIHAIITLVVIVNICKIAESKMTIEQIKNTLKPYKSKCLRVTGADPELVEGTKTGAWPKDRTLMCFTKCIYNMMKVIKNDDISLKAVFSQIDLMVPDEYVAQMKEIVEKCLEMANSKATDLCDKTWLLSKCFYEADSSYLHLLTFKITDVKSKGWKLIQNELSKNRLNNAQDKR